MGHHYYVQQGEYLAQIARANGFASYKPIWEAPENSDLKEKRKNPNILLPGDKLFIPDKETREESVATDQKHRFEARVEKLILRVMLMGLKKEPLAGHECALVVEGDSEQITTGGDGKLEKTIPATAGAGKLTDRGKPGPGLRVEREIPLKIGNLDPVTEISGQIGRLNNLGYLAGDLPDHALAPEEEDLLRHAPEFLSAVEEFQCDFGLKVDGMCGKNTQSKLVEVHGC